MFDVRTRPDHYGHTMFVVVDLNYCFIVATNSQLNNISATRLKKKKKVRIFLFIAIFLYLSNHYNMYHGGTERRKHLMHYEWIIYL